MARAFYEIRKQDVGENKLRCFGQTWDSPIGTVLPGDAGKRVYLVGDILQAENNWQREERGRIDLDETARALRKALAPPAERKTFVIEITVSTVQHWTVEAYDEEGAEALYRNGDARHWPDKDFVLDDEERINDVREPHASEGF